MGCTSSNIVSTDPPEPKIAIESTITDEKIRNNTMTDTDEKSRQSISWSERRNSQKEKDIIFSTKFSEARIELGKRLSYRNRIYAKCTRCGDLSTESSNNYYGYYLIVTEINTKAKCRRCNLHFSFEHFGVVKSVEEIIDMIIEEMAE